MRGSIVLLGLLGFALTLSVAIAVAHPRRQLRATRTDDDIFIQTDGPAESHAHMKWNGARNEFVSYGGYEHQQSSPLPLIDIYPVSGQKRSVDVLANFPFARSVSIDSLTVGADGSVLVACSLNISRHASERILLFDRRGALVKNLSAVLDKIGAVAMDGQGKMFALGRVGGERSSHDSHPLIVGYDQSGHLAEKMLPRELFADTDDPVGDALGDLLHGGSRMTITNEAVEVYLAPVGELIVLSRRGEIRTRVSVTILLSEFAEANGYKAVYVDQDEFSPSGGLWLVGHFEEPQRDSGASHPTSNFVVRLTKEGGLQTPYEHVGQESPGHYLPSLIGFTQSNEPVAFLWDEFPDEIHLRRNPY
jgi:hypothetical protein